MPQNDVPTPCSGEQNRWCVEGEWQISEDAKMVMARKWRANPREKRRVLTGSLHLFRTFAVIQPHKVARMARDRGASVRRWSGSSMLPICPSWSSFRSGEAQLRDPFRPLIRGCPWSISCHHRAISLWSRCWSLLVPQSAGV
ncbi:hypothetical protein H5410_054841 [Solanum commersonii]|uniref:Uncharacterized protein n=1 Tax=Solanum commersonii TaxID=4109 RepID=A0A9J5WFZ9_SOLCO|nr:hypothetical protein H5410_054841 [Solanum commersonii]